MSVLTIIPARANSKRLPGKNRQKILGQPLVERAAQTASYAGFYPYVLTNDRLLRNDVCGVAVGWLEEPEWLAADDVPMAVVLGWCLERIPREDTEGVMLLQATAPMVEQSDLIACVDMFKRSGCDSVVSVVGVKEGAHVRYEHNGAIYLSKPDVIRRGQVIGGWTQFYVMPPERSIDINTAEDLAEARRLAGDG